MHIEKPFETLDELYDNIRRGGEIEFIYDDKNYSITHAEGEIYVMEQYNSASIIKYTKPEDVGEYIVAGKKIKEILNELIIVFRCF